MRKGRQVAGVVKKGQFIPIGSRHFGAQRWPKLVALSPLKKSQTLALERSGLIKEVVFRLREEKLCVKAGPSQQLFSWSQRGLRSF
jgi:hypothetical protein